MRSKHTATQLRLCRILARAACSFGLWPRQQAQARSGRMRFSCILHGDRGYTCASSRQKAPAGRRGEGTASRSAIPAGRASWRVPLELSRTPCLTDSCVVDIVRHRENTPLSDLSGHCDGAHYARTSVRLDRGQDREKGLSNNYLNPTRITGHKGKPNE